MVIKYIRKLLGSRKKKPAEGASEAHAAPPPETHLPLVHHRPIPLNLIDPDAAKIIKRLRRFGHTAYIVGGGVRDLLLTHTPKDFDIGTSARPNEVRKLFRNCRIIGRRFRLAHIYFHDKIIEVATYRSNQPEDLAAAEETAEAEARISGDARALERLQSPRTEGDLLIRSDNVFGTPETDALRRDFTINALFYDIESGNVIDYVGGIADLDAHVMRMIGDPEVRLREDPIRILRAIRLAGRLDFTIEPKTLASIKRHKGDIRYAAAPRILEDFLRMFRKGGAETAMTLMHELGVDEIVMPELIASAKPGDHEFQRKTLHSLDLGTARGTEFSNATLLSLVFYPFVRRVIENADPDAPNTAFSAIDKIVGGFEQRLVVPKRERERIRQILIAQKRFVAKGHHGKRFSTGSFVRKPFFPEAFDLFDIITSATGANRDEVKRWKIGIASAAVASDGASLGPDSEAVAAGTSDGRTGRRRRRRGGRGRGESGRPHGGAGTPGAHARREPEPIIIPELAPGENPYGDAIAVPIPSGGARASVEGSPPVSHHR